MELSGGPAKVAVILRGRKRKRTLAPRAVTFDPAGAERNSFSFTFGHNFGFRAPLSRYEVQWRAAGDEAVTMHKGSLQILYRAAKGSACLGRR